MLRKLFAQKVRPAAQTPPGTVIYAVGDVHGRADLLAPLLETVLQDARESRVEHFEVVFLGDYVDRGADSRRVLDLLIAFTGVKGLRTHFLRGNHDETMLEFLRDPSAGPTWCDFGGRETLMSYGVTPPAARNSPDAWALASEALRRELPDAHYKFLAGLISSCSLGDYFFCHAGARPGVALDLQTDHDLLWIRNAFLNDARPFDQVVVHGHTPAEDVHSDQRRIGVDTGAYATGVLSAVRLEGEGRAFIQVSAQGRREPSVTYREAEA